MTELEILALEVRQKAAHALLKHGEITGPDALALIVVPTDDVLEASLLAAAQLVETRPERRERPAPERARRRGFSEMMAAYAD